MEKKDFIPIKPKPFPESMSIQTDPLANTEIVFIPQKPKELKKKKSGSGLKYCVVATCKSRSDGRYKFYNVLRKDENLTKKWVQAIGRTNKDGSPWWPTKSSFICSRHFVNGRLVNGPLVFLNETQNAKPSNAKPSSTEPSSTKPSSMTPEISEVIVLITIYRIWSCFKHA